MCKSVPQIEAAFTRTSTSPCPTSGTGTLSIRNPFAASIFRSAFIVAAIPASSSLLPQLINAQSQILAPFGVRRAQPPLLLSNLCHPIPTIVLSRGPQFFLIQQRVSKCLRVPHPSRLSAKGGLLRSNGEIFCSALFSLLLYFLTSLLHLFHHPNLLQRLQILHHQLQRHRPILRRHRIPNLLRIPLPIRKIQNLVRILLTAAPQSFVLQQFRLRRMPPLCPLHLKIIKPKHSHRPQYSGNAAQSQNCEAIQFLWSRRAFWPVHSESFCVAPHEMRQFI